MDKKDIALTLLKEEIAQGKLCVLGIASHWSMYPLFEKQSAVKLRNVSIKDLCLGDIVVYKKDQNLIAHRYIRIVKIKNEKTIITKGDNVASFDHYFVAEEELLGKIISFTTANKTINCENTFWRSINAFLARVSLWQANYTLAVYKLDSSNLASVGLRKILIFIDRMGGGIRIILVKLLVSWIWVIS